MPIIRKSRAFKDISLSFKPHPVTKDLPALVNERAIVRSVRNLIETIPTERFFRPDIGTNIRDSLFENFHPTLLTIIEDQIKETLDNYEPRINNVNVQLDPYVDNNAFEATIFFDIVGLDVPTQSFTFLLEPTR